MREAKRCCVRKAMGVAMASHQGHGLNGRVGKTEGRGLREGGKEGKGEQPVREAMGLAMACS